jgi:hypothetical protein
MVYILIIMLQTNFNVVVSTSITTAEFFRKDTCEEAGKKIKEIINSSEQIRYICVKK